jgi:hypothetical protein
MHMRNSIGRVALIGVLVAGGLMTIAWWATPAPPRGADGQLSFAEVFQRPESRAEVMINRRDGPAFAQLATDLTLHHPEGFHDYFAGSAPRDELAYRAGRPMQAWLAWILSGGARRPLLAPALMLLTVAGLGALVATTAFAAVRLGRDPKWAWTAVLLPGLGVSIWAPGGCEPLAIALTLFGWILWSCDHRTRLPLLLWCLAALTRETSLIIPVALALLPGEPIKRRLQALLIPAGTYGIWLLVVRWQTGLFPGNAGGGRVSALFKGLVDEASHWGPGEWLFLVLILAFAVLAWRVALPGTRAVLALHVALASSLGHLVWEQAIDYSRIFALVELLGLLALLPRVAVEQPSLLVDAE